MNHHKNDFFKKHDLRQEATSKHTANTSLKLKSSNEDIQKLRESC